MWDPKSGWGPKGAPNHGRGSHAAHSQRRGSGGHQVSERSDGNAASSSSRPRPAAPEDHQAPAGVADAPPPLVTMNGTLRDLCERIRDRLSDLQQGDSGHKSFHFISFRFVRFSPLSPRCVGWLVKKKRENQRRGNHHHLCLALCARLSLFPHKSTAHLARPFDLPTDAHAPRPAPRHEIRSEHARQLQLTTFPRVPRALNTKTLKKIQVTINRVATTPL